MPLNLTKLAANRASVAIDFGNGETLNVQYYPEKLTGQMVLDATAAASDGASEADQGRAAIMANANMLLTILASLDAVEDDADGNEQPYPLDLAHLLALSLSSQRKILEAITRDAAGEASAARAASPAN